MSRFSSSGIPSSEFKNVTGYVHSDFRHMLRECEERLRNEDSDVDRGTVFEALILSAHRHGMVSLEELEEAGPSMDVGGDSSDANARNSDDVEPSGGGNVEAAQNSQAEEEESGEEGSDEPVSIFEKELF